MNAGSVPWGSVFATHFMPPDAELTGTGVGGGPEQRVPTSTTTAVSPETRVDPIARPVADAAFDAMIGSKLANTPSSVGTISSAASLSLWVKISLAYARATDPGLGALLEAPGVVTEAFGVALQPAAKNVNTPMAEAALTTFARREIIAERIRPGGVGTEAAISRYLPQRLKERLRWVDYPGVNRSRWPVAGGDKLTKKPQERVDFVAPHLGATERRARP